MSTLPTAWLAVATGYLGVVTGLTYVGIGVIVALLLARRGAATATALSALACWPLLLPLLSQTASSRTPGPFGARIEDGLSALRETMADPAAEDVAPPADLDGLVLDLYRADERLAMVDRLLRTVMAERDPSAADSAVTDGLETLRRARASAAAEVEAVLDGIVQLRLQIGLRSLAGNSVPVRERLRDLRARLAAVDEIAALELSNS